MYLGSDEYWAFSAPRYVGETKTKLRFSFKVDDEKVIYSNEFEGSINQEQFTEKQGHKAENVMDPYDD